MLEEVEILKMYLKNSCKHFFLFMLVGMEKYEVIISKW
jgi:hypothetical protein